MNNFNRQFNVSIMKKNEILQKTKTNLNLIIIKHLPLTKQIKNIPTDIQKKIYIFAMKHYYKYIYTPLSNKIPSWYSYKLYIQNQIKQCYFDNIHFLHLEMNTLPKYKKYIPGCQCDFCKNHKKIHYPISHLINERNFNNFIIKLNPDSNNYWTQFYDLYGMKIFDPLNIKLSDYPTYFSELNNF